MFKDRFNQNQKEQTVHEVLIESYSWYFLFFLTGVIIDIIFPVKFLPPFVFAPSGLLIAIASSFLIFWAQKSSRNLDVKNLTKETFSKGPYKYMRNPTQLGLFLLLLGLGMMVNAAYLILFTMIYFLTAERIFIKREERILEKKYGKPFIEYKESLRF